MICGWCMTGHCEEGHIPGCTHTSRCKVNQTQVKADTERAKQKALAHLRRGRMESTMMHRIEMAWTQLDIAVDEIVRLNQMIERHGQDGDIEGAASFEHDLATEKAKALGKAEILALLMPAPYNTPEAISKESGRRFQVRQQGQEPTTPGIRAAAAALVAGVAPGRILTDAEAVGAVRAAILGADQ